MDEQKYWKKEGERWTGEIEGFISDRAAVRNAAQSAIAGVSDPHERLQKLYAIAQNVRNLTFEPDKTRQESNALRGNRSAEDVLRNGYGTSDEINRLFVALARGAGFDASVVRVADRSERFFVKEQEQGDQLNNEIALVTVEGKPELSDPGTPLAPYGLLAWQKAGVFGLRIDRKSANWLAIPEQPPQSAKVRRTIELHLELNPPFATVIVMRTGQAALARRLGVVNDDGPAAKAKLLAEARRSFPDGTAIHQTNVNGLRNSAVPLIERYEVELPSLATATGSRLLLPMSICNITRKPPFTAAERRNPIYFEYRWRDDDEVTLAVPKDDEVESLPAATNRDLGGLSFETQYQQEGDRVRFARHLVGDAVLIDKAKYDVVRDFFNGAAAADQQQIVLRKRASH